MSQPPKLLRKSDLLKLYEWFSTTIELFRPIATSISHEFSPKGREPASLVVNVDTEDRVATAQIWDSGDIYLECMDIATEETILREHIEALDEPEIKKYLEHFLTVVYRRPP